MSVIVALYLKCEGIL